MSRVVRLLGRTKAYITECKQNMAPLPNPEWYEEGKDTRVTFKNLRKLPLSVHTEIWSSTWKWYRESFAESFAWSRKRKEETKKREAHEKMNTLRGMVKEAREVTHNSPEDLEKSKEALKELMEEIHENRDELKSAAQEKLDLIRVSLSEFSTGYRQARDEEIKRVMAMDKSMLQSFLSERAGEVKHATSVIADAILEKDGGAGGSSSREEGGRSSPASRSAPAPPSNNNAAPDAPSVARPQEQPGTVSSSTAASDAESHPSNDPGHADLDGGATRFLSPRARRAVDDVLRDPDVERLAGRAKGFARERLLKAEEAARIIKGEEEESGERKRPGGVEVGEGEGEGGSDTETPIISGLASDASDFVAARVGQATEGAKEVVEAAMDARRARRAAADGAERSTKATAPGGGDSGGPVDDSKDGTKR